MPLIELTSLARTLILMVLAVLHVVTVLCTGVVIQHLNEDRSNEYILLTVFGVCSGQASVAAVWMALGPQRLATRGAIALLGLAFAGLPMFGFALRENLLWRLLIFNGVLLTQFAILQLPLWYLRMKRGRSLRLTSELPNTDKTPLQFGIGQLLLWTAGTALVFGVARLMMPNEVGLGVGKGPGFHHIICVALLLLGFHTVLPLSIIAAAFARQFMPLWVCLALLVAACGSWLEPRLFAWLLSPRGSGEESLFLWLNGAHVAWLLGSLLVLRICGYRLS